MMETQLLLLIWKRPNRSAWLAWAHPQVRGADLQPRAHVQEVRRPLGLQDGIDGHAAPRRGVQQVLQDLQVSQEVHDDGHHLEREEQVTAALVPQAGRITSRI